MELALELENGVEQTAPAKASASCNPLEAKQSKLGKKGRPVLPV